LYLIIIIYLGGEHIDIEICVSEGGPLPSSVVSVAIPHSLLDHNNGKYTVTYTIPRGVKLRQVSVSVAVNGLPITGSPFLVSIETQRTRNAWKRIATFGTEGAQIGQFCRPWGVAIVRLPNKDNFDMNGIREYLIAVADRSNNRIQLLKLRLNSNFSKTPDRTDSSSSLSNNGYASAAPNSSNSSNGDVSLSVVHVFGSGPGTRPGQFDRPAGIAINVNLGHIIVADKDNHRIQVFLLTSYSMSNICLNIFDIQVFDISGTYLFKFGDKGSRPGQFCYPWDIDSCPQTSQILVSDTRNRRVQLFTPYGQYLWHCGQPLDSPRGVSFISSDKFVISDFNKHRLLIIDKTNNNGKEDITPKYIGFGEGSAWGEFLRPQGVVSSGATSIFCADSRNNRISIWNSVTQSFDYLTDEVISLDRPSGLSVADNLLVVVDFGNNRIQICQR
jgi:tripartite motif-containing protein 71